MSVILQTVPPRIAEIVQSNFPVIGGTLGLTGTFSGPSAAYQAAYQYWTDQVNEQGGLLGRQVELKIYDDESDPTTAQQQASVVALLRDFGFVSDVHPRLSENAVEFLLEDVLVVQNLK
jgi:hypothetical protein